MKKHIIIIDDNEMFTEFLSEYLSFDYEVIVIHDPQEALNNVSDIQPDLILLDHNLGTQIDGLGVIKNLKMTGLLEDIPTLLITGEISSDLRINALSQGAEDVILKPFNPKELKLRIQKVLDRKLQTT